MSKNSEYKADAKKKSLSNIIDEKAINIVKSILPCYWTIRDYKPDYGIDLVVETFDEDTRETLGEHFFVQVKGKKDIVFGTFDTIYQGMEYHIPVVKYQLETDLLVTVQRMGHAIPVMLFIVDIANNCIYFINLNDYIDKVFLINNIDFENQKTININIPVDNIIKTNDDSNKLYFYSKRAKFYSFFETVKAQADNLNYVVTWEDFKNITKKYAIFLLKYDIIKSKKSDYYFSEIKEMLIDITNDFKQYQKQHNDDKEDKIWEISTFNGLYSKYEGKLYLHLKMIWEQLCNIQGMYEDCWRECMLPTGYYAMYMNYPTK